MLGLTLSPAWGAVLAIVTLGVLIALTHIVSLRVG